MRDVPFYSQFTDSVCKEWQPRICGITSLKMVIDFWNKENDLLLPSIKELLEKGLAEKSFVENIGWTHKGLVNLAQQSGFSGYNKDLADLDIDKAWDMFEGDLKKFPLIVSVLSRFDPQRKDTHLVVAIDMEDDFVFINDPAEIDESSGRKKISKSDFQKVWRKKYIAIFPRFLMV